MYDYATTSHQFSRPSELFMNEHAKRIQKPRCFLLYAIAPNGFPAAEANRILNAFIGDPDLPLAIFHDHFIGQSGGSSSFMWKRQKNGMHCSLKNIWMAGEWRSNR